MATVTQKFDADGRSVERELEKMRGEYDKLMQKMEAAGKRSRRSHDEAKSGIEGYAKGLATAAASALSLQAGLQLVTKEMSKQKKAQEDIARRSLPIAASQDLVAKMIGPVGAKATNTFLDQVRQIQADTGFGSIAQLNVAAADTLSATGGDQQKTLDILRAAAPLFRQDPTSLPTVAGGIADVMGASGLSAIDATALANTALGQSRLTQLSAFKEIAKAIGGGEGLFGSDKEDSAKIIAGLFGTMSRASKDPEGATTKTATVKMLQTLEQMGDGTFEERLARLQAKLASGELQEAKLMEGYDSASYSAVRSIYRNDPAIMQDLTATISKTKNTSRRDLAELVQFLTDGTPEINDAVERIRQEAGLERANASPAGYDATDAERAMAIYNEAKANTRVWTPGKMVEGFGDEVGSWFGLDGDTLDASRRSAQEIARVRRKGIESNLRWLEGNDTPNAQRDREIYNTALQALKNIEANTKATALKDNNRARNAAAQSAVHTER